MKFGKQGVHSLYLFEISKQKVHSDQDDLISFSVIYRFIRLRHEITEICSVNRKHRSNWTVTLSYGQMSVRVDERAFKLSLSFDQQFLCMLINSQALSWTLNMFKISMTVSHVCWVTTVTLILVWPRAWDLDKFSWIQTRWLNSHTIFARLTWTLKGVNDKI